MVYKLETFTHKIIPAEQISPISSEVIKWFPIPEEGEVNFEARIRPEKINIPDRVIYGLQKFIHKSLKDISGYSKPELDGVLIGLSGGVDSTTVAAITQSALKGTQYFTKGLILGRGPFGEQGEMNNIEYQDVLYAMKSAEDMKLEYEYLDISPFVNSAYSLFPQSKPWELSGILPRIRSTLLLQSADNNNAICAGSTNGTEFLLGSFSVGGPAGHFTPLVDFYKSEVYKIAEIFDVPNYIRERKPAISELGIYDEQLYGGSCYILDPVLRRMGYQKRSPESVAEELGHSVNWLKRIKDLRLEGEKGRKFPPTLTVGRGFDIKIKPDYVWDRDSYFKKLI